MLKQISKWFAETPVSQDYRVADYALLSLILAIGVFVRFWGLGNVGLHGDEETMALPAMAILETGHPILPSGMYYARALLNIYLMSGSVWLFGESEWAFRLPSAVVGSCAGLAAFFMGRRFLDPHFNLALVATITFMPSLIQVSQTARMYVFFVTCIVWFAACIFKWERDGRSSSLLLALLVWMLALHFQTLAIFTAPLFLFPGLSKMSWPQLGKGVLAFTAGFALFKFYSKWIGSKYPSHDERPPQVDGGTESVPLDALFSAEGWLVFVGISVAVLVISLSVMALRQGIWRDVLPLLVFGSGIFGIAILQFHIGAILLLLGAAFWLRSANLPRFWLIGGLVLAAMLATVHLGVLHSSGLFPGRKLIGAVIGTPSVWPIFRFLEYSPVSGVLYGLFLIFVLGRFTKGDRLPMHVLFFAIAVWAPLLLIGYFAWYVPPRYTQGQLGFFLLCTFAGFTYVCRRLTRISTDGRLSTYQGALVGLLVVGLINPWALVQAINPTYGRNPDHKGAAEYIKSLDLPANTILIAEDVLQQTYYLGRVNYWLNELDNAAGFSVVREGLLVDQYTHTPVLGSDTELLAVIGSSKDRDIYVIGSGENFVGEKRQFRGRGISQLLDSERFEIVHVGRDGRTTVWKLWRPDDQ